MSASAELESAIPITAPIPLIEGPVAFGAGPGLRRARAAMEAGDRDTADRLLAELAQRFPLIADYVALERLRLSLEAGDEQRAIALREEWHFPESPLAAEFHALLGGAYARARDEERARAAWSLALEKTDAASQRATLHLELARSFQRSRRAEQAAEHYERIWTSYPESPEESDAAAGLAVLELQLGRLLRTASAYRRRADTLFRLRHNERALAVYDAALELGGMSRSETRRAQRRRAQTLFRLRRYPEAVEAFGALSGDTEARIERARSIARSGDVRGGARELERIGAAARDWHGARANLLAALLWDGEGESERARRLFAEVLRRAPSSSYAAAALWRLGWEAFRAGRYAEAVDDFERLAARERDPLAQLRPRYWRARAQERSGDTEAAGRAFAAIASEFPLSYYGWRARTRARGGAGYVAPDALSPGSSSLSPGDLARPRILLEAGLLAEASRELDYLARRARGLEDRLALAHLYASAGDFNQPQRLILDAYTQELARGVVPVQIDLWWYAWPQPFGREIASATGNGAVDPALVYSVMREESGYRPEVISVSGARGLLQIMPETGERLAAEVAMANFSPDDLFLPAVNIRLGSTYLTQLLGRFGGRVSAAIGSYNAGPTAVARWVQEGPPEDDEWVEAIPYEQTRGYVKRVLRSLYAYRVLY